MKMQVDMRWNIDFFEFKTRKNFFLVKTRTELQNGILNYLT